MWSCFRPWSPFVNAFFCFRLREEIVKIDSIKYQLNKVIRDLSTASSAKKEVKREGSCAPWHRRRAGDSACEPSSPHSFLLNPPPPSSNPSPLPSMLIFSGGYQDSQMSVCVSPMLDINICASLSWKALSTFPDRKSACFNARLGAKVKYCCE